MPPSTIRATIDISPIVYGRGVSLYTSNLVRSLIRSEGVDVRLFGNSLRQMHVLKAFTNEYYSEKKADFRRLPPKLLSALWYEWKKPAIESFLKEIPDVFHAWEELVPPALQVPIVATIHDLAMLHFPETAHPQTLYKHQQAWKRLKAQQSHLIAVSHATKKDIVNLLEIPAERVHVVYEALPREHKQRITKNEAENILTPMGILRPYILYVGTLEPRKNIDRLVQAWLPHKQEVDLVLAGKMGWGITADLSQNGIHALGTVSKEQLIALYTQASIFTYPSLYEGFGLPILEAFFHELPVLTSNSSAMSEISGQAAMLCDPLDISSISESISKLLNESASKQTYRLQAMKLQLQLFHWGKTAEKTIEVYKKAKR